MIPIFYSFLSNKIDNLIKEETAAYLAAKFEIPYEPPSNPSMISSTCVQNLTIFLGIIDFLAMVTGIVFGIICLLSSTLPHVVGYCMLPTGAAILIGWIVAYFKCGWCKL
jgi:hypothetical protein